MLSSFSYVPQGNHFLLYTITFSLFLTEVKNYMNIKRYCRYADWFSFSITLTLSLIGLLFVFSSTYTPEQPYSLFFKKQIIGIITGFMIYFFFSSTNIQSITQWGFYSYFATLLL